jgi:hypothetical protein
MSYTEFREDMSKYVISDGINLSILNIGWIGYNTSYSLGDAPNNFIEKLKKLIANSESFPFKPIVWRSRGQDMCPVCQSRDLVLQEGENIEILGSSEFFIPCNIDNSYFISPSLIYHFITDRKYLPPQKFIDSVLAIDENAGFDGENTYMSAQGLGEFMEI